LEDLRLVIGAWPLMLALLGLIAWSVDGPRRARRAAALLLLVPLPFHIQSMAHAAVPLYVPTLFPNTYWNLRLGMEMLPGVALLASFLVPAAGSKRARGLLVGGLLLLLVAQYASTLGRGARELAIAKEGALNTPCRSKRQQDLAQFLRERYDGQTILMAAGKWPCVLPSLGIPYRKTVSDANHELWAGLSIAPEKTVAWIVRGSDEPVDWFMRAHAVAFTRFEVVFEETVPGEGQLIIYRRAPE
jgi:hypothetical protein